MPAKYAHLDFDLFIIFYRKHYSTNHVNGISQWKLHLAQHAQNM